MQCCDLKHRHSLHCLIPPYLLDRIVQHGSPDERAAALKAKSLDQSLHALRMNALAGRPTKRAAPLVGSSGLPSKRRSIYTARNEETLPGTLVRSEGSQPSGDPAVDEAYDGLGATFDFFAEVLQRNSIDDAGLPLDATVHFSYKYSNAYWDSVRMVFGDGGDGLFNRFTLALEVIGHELTHGVTEHDAKLQYFNQSGALNESVSDVFGSLIKQYHLKQTAAQADWLVGVGLFTPRVHGKAIRSMKDPGSAFDDEFLGKDPQPKHMDHYVNTFLDNGGVHTNSGIPNHAFYQVAMGIGGKAWEQAGRIWYDTLRDPRVQPDANFQTFAEITHAVAGTRHGLASREQKAVKDGWAAVGIKL